MNIDRQKFKEAIERGDTQHKSIMQVLDDCEVKCGYDKCDNNTSVILLILTLQYAVNILTTNLVIIGS